MLSNFEGPRGYGIQVVVDWVGGVGGILGVPSEWVRWRGWGCCSGFLSERWFDLHVCMNCCIAAREGLDVVLHEQGGFSCDLDGGG